MLNAGFLGSKIRLLGWCVVVQNGEAGVICDEDPRGVEMKAEVV